MDGGREKTRFCGFVWEEKEKEKEREWREEEEGEEEEGEEEGEVVMGKVENVRYWPISLSVSSPSSSSVLVQLKISNFRIRVVGSVQVFSLFLFISSRFFSFLILFSFFSFFSF